MDFDTFVEEIFTEDDFEDYLNENYEPIDFPHHALQLDYGTALKNNDYIMFRESYLAHADAEYDFYIQGEEV